MGPLEVWHGTFRDPFVRAVTVFPVMGIQLVWFVCFAPAFIPLFLVFALLNMALDPL